MGEGREDKSGILREKGTDSRCDECQSGPFEKRDKGEYFGFVGGMRRTGSSEQAVSG